MKKVNLTKRVLISLKKKMMTHISSSKILPKEKKKLQGQTLKHRLLF